jgi:hypothetical protein
MGDSIGDGFSENELSIKGAGSVPAGSDYQAPPKTSLLAKRGSSQPCSRVPVSVVYRQRSDAIVSVAGLRKPAQDMVLSRMFSGIIQQACKR